MFRVFRRKASPAGLLTSKLFDASTFYKCFLADLKKCRREAIIESPFITGKHLAVLKPTLNEVYAGEGNDVVVVKGSSNTVHGGNGADKLYALAGGGTGDGVRG